ncbi:gas vesicle protein GvpJ [Spirillospora sp. CA-255316]
MTVSQVPGSQVERSSRGTLGDVVELILEKGLVIDAFVRVSLVGIEVITIDARIVVASVDTYLRFAEATNRLDLYEKGGGGLPELAESVTESGSRGGARGKTKGVLDAAGETIQEALSGRVDDREEEEVREPRRTRSRRERER